MKVLNRTILFILFLLTTQWCTAQNGRFAGMGNSSIMLTDFWAITNNQAGLAQINAITAGIDYHNRFNLKETSTQTGGFVLPTKTGNFSLAWTRFGYHLYSENSLGLGFSRTLGEYLSAGVQFNYVYINQSEDYGNRGTPVLQLGIIAEPVENLTIGTHIYNVSRSKIEELHIEQLPTNFRMGVGYYFPAKIQLSLEAEKETSKQLNIKTGLEYEPVKNWYIRSGLNTHPNQYSFGLGYRVNQLHIDLSASTHELLPLSSQISLTYTFQKK